MRVLEDVFDVVIFLVLLLCLVWYVIFARSYLSDISNWGFKDNDDKTAQLVHASDSIIYDEGYMSKAELLLSAYVWDTKSLEVNTINYSTALVKTNSDVGASDVLQIKPEYTLEIDAEYKTSKLDKVKELGKYIIANPSITTGTRFSVMYVPDAAIGTPLMYYYSDKGLSNFGTKLKTVIGSDVSPNTSMSVMYLYGAGKEQGDTKDGTGAAVKAIKSHWEVILN